MFGLKLITTNEYEYLTLKVKTLRRTNEQIEKAIQILEDCNSELQKAFDKTEHCCPYDQEKCSKTNCFIIGGDCSRRTKKQEAREEK